MKLIINYHRFKKDEIWFGGFDSHLYDDENLELGEDIIDCEDDLEEVYANEYGRASLVVVVVLLLVITIFMGIVLLNPTDPLSLGGSIDEDYEGILVIKSIVM